MLIKILLSIQRLFKQLNVCVFLGSTFQVKPHKGLVEDKYELFVVRLTPKTDNIRLSHELRCRFNDDSKHDKNIELLGSSEQPNILLDSEVSINS